MKCQLSSFTVMVRPIVSPDRSRGRLGGLKEAGPSSAASPVDPVFKSNQTA